MQISNACTYIKALHICLLCVCIMLKNAVQAEANNRRKIASKRLTAARGNLLADAENDQYELVFLTK